MVELTPGSGVYLYQHDIDYVQRVRDPSAQGTAAYGKRIAELLMNIFFTKKDFPDCKLSPNAKGQLDETVTSAIISKFSFIVLSHVSYHYVLVVCYSNIYKLKSHYFKQSDILGI